uniref:Uncharacterized protein n=1 Tax=Acrobeloides nanus TaxID=290746 RepID=A0A914CHH9_9BILA
MTLQFVFVLAVVAKSVLATTCPSSCPNLNIASGSQPITQTMTTNQYNCTSPHIKCVNPNGGSVYFVFYYNGTQVASVSGNGAVFDAVNCSTEKYQWITVNGAGVK